MPRFPQLSRDQIRTCLLYDYKSGMKPSDSYRRMVHSFGEGVVSMSTVHDWFKKFKAGHYEVEDKERSGRPSVLNNDELREQVEGDPCQTAREMSSKLGCHHSTVVRHLAEIGKVSKRNVWVPHSLSERDKIRRMETCTELLSRRRTFAWLDDIVTGDEKWCLYVNVSRKRSWTDVGQVGETMPKPEKHEHKVMLSVFWDVRGPIYWELLPQQTTVTAEVYCTQLENLADAVRIKRPGKAVVRFLHDNARPHVSKMTRQKVLDLGWEILPHPPYSPDLAPSDYHLFRSMQHFLDGKQFSNDEEVKVALEEYFGSKQPEFYASGIHDLPNRWRKVLECDGNYFVE